MTIEYKGFKIEVEDGDVEINGDTITFKGKEGTIVHEHHYHYENETVNYPWWSILPNPNVTTPTIAPNPWPTIWCSQDLC